MGGPYSPTVANIYMFVTLRNFLQTHSKTPFLFKRYIDDIYIIWTHTMSKLDVFFSTILTHLFNTCTNIQLIFLI